MVVKEDHSLAEHHGPRRPGKNRHLADQVGDPEEAQSVEKYSNVAARYRKGLTAPDLQLDLETVLLDRAPTGRLQALLELGMHLSDAIEMMTVEFHHRGQRRVALRLEEGEVPLTAQQLLSCAEGVSETQPVELPQRPQSLLALPIGREKLEITLEDIFGPSVEQEVDYRAADVFAEFVDLGLTLLPAGRHHGNRATVVGSSEFLSQERLQALGTE
jgi:hypothetical protein